MNEPARQDSNQPSPPPAEDGTRFNLALLGFYVSCTIVGVAVTIAAAALIVFGNARYSGLVATVTIVIALAASVSTWICLSKARGDS